MVKETTTIGEILNDADFKKAFKDVYFQNVHNREKRPSPIEGKTYKRDWYDGMKDSGILSFDFFFSELPKVWTKQSDLSKEFRDVILFFGNVALNKFMK